PTSRIAPAWPSSAAVSPSPQIPRQRPRRAIHRRRGLCRFGALAGRLGPLRLRGATVPREGGRSSATPKGHRRPSAVSWPSAPSLWPYLDLATPERGASDPAGPTL